MTGMETASLTVAIARQSGPALVELAARAAMDGDEGNARLFGTPGKLRGIQAVVIPAETHFHCHGNRDRADHGLDQPRCVVEVAHQGGAGIAGGHPLRRAAHIDVEEIGAGGFEPARAFRERLGLAPGKLYRVGGEAGGFGTQMRLFTAGDQFVACHHFRNHQTRAEAVRQPPERRIGNARHRRQEYGIFQPQITDRGSVVPHGPSHAFAHFIGRYTGCTDISQCDALTA